MAGTEPMLFAVEGTRQAAQLGTLSGKSFVVGQVSSAGTGLTGNWLFLQPAGEVGATVAKKTVAIKLEGARQMAGLSSLTGKTVVVGKAPVTVGGACNWLALNPVTGSAVAGGAATPGAAAGLTMVKLEGGRQAVQLSGMAGKTFTVIPSPMLGAKGGDWVFMQPSGGGKIVALKVQANAGSVTSSSLVGKSFVVGKGQVMAGKGGASWLMLKPAALAKGGGACASVVGGGAAAGCPLAQAQTVALTTPAATVAKGGAAVAPVAAAGTTGSVAGKAAVAKAAGGGVIWKGTGMGLGVGLGLGAWGPAILLGAAVTGVGVYSYLKRRKEAEVDGDAVEAATM